MVTGCLAKSGYFMGDNLYEPRGANPKGFYESPDINNLNEEILAGSVKDRLRIFGHEFFKENRPVKGHRWIARIPISAPIRGSDAIDARIASLVKHEPFCFKDPRFSYTLPVWRPHLQNAVFVCVFREPSATAISMTKEIELVRRDYKIENYLNEEQAEELWYLIYRHVTEKHMSEGKWLFLHYDQLLSADGLDRLEEFTGANVDRDFPDKSLKRSVVTKVAGQKKIEALYDHLCDLAGYRPA